MVASCGPRLPPVRCGGGQGFGLRSQIGPVLRGLGSISSVQPQDSRVQLVSSCVCGSATHRDQRVHDPLLIADLVEDGYSLLYFR